MPNVILDNGYNSEQKKQHSWYYGVYFLVERSTNKNKMSDYKCEEEK